MFAWKYINLFFNHLMYVIIVHIHMFMLLFIYATDSNIFLGQEEYFLCKKNLSANILLINFFLIKKHLAANILLALFPWSRKILWLTFLNNKSDLIYYAKVLATIYFLIKKRKLFLVNDRNVLSCWHRF